MTALKRTEHNASLSNCRQAACKGPYVASFTHTGELLVTQFTGDGLTESFVANKLQRVMPPEKNKSCQCIKVTNRAA